jgi:hypothetical protein
MARQRLSPLLTPEQADRKDGKNTGQTNLLVLQPQKQHLLHERQLRLLAALGALADVARIKGDAVAVLAALVAGLGPRRGVADVGGRIGPRAGANAAIVPLSIVSSEAAGASSGAAPAPRQARGGGHGVFVFSRVSLFLLSFRFADGRAEGWDRFAAVLFPVRWW